MVVFMLLFGQLAKIPTDGIPGPIFYFSAPGTLDLLRLNPDQCGDEPRIQYRPLTKIYFPRVILPTAVALGNVMDFFIRSALFVGLIVYYKIHPGWNLLLWPALAVLLMLLSLSLGAFFAALNVKYRDI